MDTENKTVTILYIPFSVPYQILVVCQQVADLCSVLGQTQEEEGPRLPLGGPDTPMW